MNIEVDVAIIGAGTAGLGARREANKRGVSWVMIDDGPLGTTCARVGCMPSKVLIAAADAAHHVSTAGTFGVRVPDNVEIDGEAVMVRVRALRDRFVGSVLRLTDSLDENQLLRGRARFTSPTTLVVTRADGPDVTVTAKSVVIATGSAPFIPDALDSVSDFVDINDTVFEWKTLPASVAVVGTGVIALELGQALARLGVRVGFFNPWPQVGTATDPKVAASVREVLGAELDIHAGVDDLTYAPSGSGVRVSWTEDGVAQHADFERVIAAAGRRPNIKGLGLENLGVALDKRGLPPFSMATLQVGDLPVFIAGDVNGEVPLLHEASDEGHIAGRNAAGYPGDVTGQPRRVHLGIAFTDPNMATVGQSYAELREGSFVTGEIDYGDQGRSRVMAVNRGIVRVYAEKETGRLLGAEMFGPRVEHTAHLLAWAIAQHMTVQRALEMPFYHPVIEEGIRTALRSAAAELRLATSPCGAGLECGPGA